MSRIFITGSSTGLGLRTGQILAHQGHHVVLHARNVPRAEETRRALPDAAAIVVGDLETIDGAVETAQAVNALGPFDAIIHNAGVYDRDRHETRDGLPRTFAVNVLAPYIMTVLVARPERLIYLSSSMHAGVRGDLEDVLWKNRRWSASTAYSESKLLVQTLAFAVSRLCPTVLSNAVDPGWVPTRMGGPSASDDLEEGCLTQAELAAPSENSPLATVSGTYFHHMAPHPPNPRSLERAVQDRLLTICAEISGHRLTEAVETPPPA